MSTLPKPSVSIIIPVYNAENFLENCLDSINNQTLKEIEIIIINDGSTDGSEEIINRYLKKDSRIVYLRQKNLGPSEARNTGLKHAYGEYLGFVDADDWVEPEMFEKLYQNSIDNDIDLAICNVWEHNHNNKTTRLEFDNEVTNSESQKILFFQHFLQFKYDYANWNKLYKRSIIKEYELKFDTTIRIGEDMLFNLEYLIFTNSIACINMNLYHHVIQQNSLMQKYNQELLGSFSYIHHIFSEEYNSLQQALTHIFKIEMASIVFYSMKQNAINNTGLKFPSDAVNKKKWIADIIKYINTDHYSLFDKIRILLLKMNCTKLFSLSLKI